MALDKDKIRYEIQQILTFESGTGKATDKLTNLVLKYYRMGKRRGVGERKKKQEIAEHFENIRPFNGPE